MSENENRRKENIHEGSSEAHVSNGQDLGKARVNAMLDEIKSSVEERMKQEAPAKVSPKVAVPSLIQAQNLNVKPVAKADGAAFLDPYAQIDEEKVAIVDPSSARQKKIRILLWSGVVLLSIVLVATILAIVIDKDNRFLGVGSIPEVTVFAGADVFGDSIKPHIPEGVEFPEGIQERFKTAYAANKNLVGWLRVPKTSIDMPIYKAKTNNDYLNTDLWGNYSRFGTVFMDAKNSIDPLGKNTVLYGHNYDETDDGRFTDLQFGEIEQYMDLEFYKQSPIIEFDTLYENHKWKVFACIVTNGTDAGDVDGDNPYLFAYHWTVIADFSFEKMIDELHQRSFIHTDVDVVPTDKMLTLSTCTYFFDRGGKLENARCAVFARLVREGESEEVDVSKAVKNENIRFPQLYYDVFGGTNPHRNTPKWFPEG